MATRDLGQRNWTAEGGRVFGKAVLWLGGVSVAILISMQATAWAHATVRTWFIATLSHGFASAMSMDQTHPNLARRCEDTPYLRAKQTPSDGQQHLAEVSTEPLERHQWR
jgi:hypothetical protein